MISYMISCSALARWASGPGPGTRAVRLRLPGHHLPGRVGAAARGHGQCPRGGSAGLDCQCLSRPARARGVAAEPAAAGRARTGTPLASSQWQVRAARADGARSRQPGWQLGGLPWPTVTVTVVTRAIRVAEGYF